MWYHSIRMHTGRYWHQSFWYWRLLSSSAEVSGYLEYELHIKGTVLCLWSSLRCVKSWIVICYRGLNFPHRAAVLLVLESDGACSSLSGHCARKSAVLILVWCYKARGDREQDLWMYWLPLGCIKQLYDKQTYRWWLPARSVDWGSNEAVKLLCVGTWSSPLTYGVKTQVLNCYDSHHWPKSPLM
jgi:hypothetical protein